MGMVTNLPPHPLNGTAWFSAREKARHKCETLVEEQVNCLDGTHRSCKSAEVANYIFRSDHFSCRYFRKDQQTAENEEQLLSSGIKDSC